MADIQCYESNLLVTIDVDAGTMTFPPRHSDKIYQLNRQPNLGTPYVLYEDLNRVQRVQCISYTRCPRMARLPY